MPTRSFQRVFSLRAIEVYLSIFRCSNDRLIHTFVPQSNAAMFLRNLLQTVREVTKFSKHNCPKVLFEFLSARRSAVLCPGLASERTAVFESHRCHISASILCPDETLTDRQRFISLVVLF
jgi:hypothetical protein